MPWPFLFLAGTKVVGHAAATAATKAAATASAKGVASAGAKGAASTGAKGTASKSSSRLHLAKTVAREVIKRVSRRNVDDDDRDDDNKK